MKWHKEAVNSRPHVMLIFSVADTGQGTRVFIASGCICDLIATMPVLGIVKPRVVRIKHRIV
jgi:hypothetical protein